jgi:trans-aconitate methyltransferase
MGGEPLKAPLPGPPKKILVVCRGPGVMTVLFGSMFPDAEVYRVDLAEVSSMEAKPENVAFTQGDIRELIGPGTKYPDIFQADSFDYVYSRAILWGWSIGLLISSLSAEALLQAGFTRFKSIHKSFSMPRTK